MGYKEVFSKEDILDIENKLLDAMERKRSDFKDPLWEDFNFVYNALPYFKYDCVSFWLLDQFVSETFYDNMLIVSRIIKNLRAVNNLIDVEDVLSNYEQIESSKHDPNLLVEITRKENDDCATEIVNLLRPKICDEVSIKLKPRTSVVHADLLVQMKKTYDKTKKKIIQIVGD